MILGLSLSLCNPGAAGEPGWTPLDITGIEAYLDPRLGATVDGSNRITSLVEQVDSEAMTNSFDGTGFEPRPATDWLPTREANAFGSLPGIRLLPVVGPPNVAAQFLTLPSRRQMASGMSIFWVSKHTSTRTVANHGAQNLPLMVTGDSTANTYNGAGFSAGELGYTNVVSAAWTKTLRGSGYNDGTARLYGWTHSTGEVLTAYVNGVQVGAAATGITYYGGLQNAWSAIGSGYRAELTGDIYGGDDGFDGLLGPVIVVNGVISGGDMALLYEWCQTTGYVP